LIKTGIKFGEIHSFFDLNLILSAVKIPPAAPKTTYVEVPGADGSVDLTEAHGEVRYSDRQLEFTFTAHPLDATDWEEKKTAVSNALNGREFNITLDKDDEFYYVGRCTVKDYNESKKIRKITVTAKVKPYKFSHMLTSETISLTSAPKTIWLHNSRKTLSPSIICSDDNTKIVQGNAEYTLNAGTHKILDIRLVEGENQLQVSGSGTVTFEYREAEL
jgi:phage-related protein